MVKRLAEQAVQVWARLIRVEQDLLARVEDELKAAGLPPLTWYDVLLELSREADGRLRQRDLQSKTLLAKYNLSRLLDRMAEAGLVTRDAVDEDARGAYVRIIAAGQAMRKTIWPVYSKGIAEHFASRLSERDIAELGRILLKLRRSD